MYSKCNNDGRIKIELMTNNFFETKRPFNKFLFCLKFKIVIDY